VAIAMNLNPIVFIFYLLISSNGLSIGDGGAFEKSQPNISTNA
jgi:hypothetical protein